MGVTSLRVATLCLTLLLNREKELVRVTPQQDVAFLDTARCCGSGVAHKLRSGCVSGPINSVTLENLCEC